MRMKEMRRLWFLTVMLIMTLALTGCGGGGGGGDDELEKVKSPVISPKGGTFINKVSVKIATQTISNLEVRGKYTKFVTRAKKVFL